MNHKTFKSYLSLAILIGWTGLVVADDCSTACCGGFKQSQNLLQMHSFGDSSRREIEHLLQSQQHPEQKFHVGADTVEYMRNFRTCKNNLGSLPFWAADESNTMTVGDGSGDYDVNAFYLQMGNVTTTGTMTLNPFVEVYGTDLHTYFGPEAGERGMFFKAHVPVGSITINPGLSDNGGLAIGTSVADYFDPLFTSPTEALSSSYYRGGSDEGFVPRKYGKFQCFRTNASQIGDINATLGYKVYNDSCKHLAIGARVGVPTSARATAEYALEPLFGNNGHWTLGGDLSGHYNFWKSEDEEKYVGVALHGFVEHMFKSRHMRSFDLANNGLGSKYMLAAKYTDTAYLDIVSTVVDLTTREVQSSFAVQGNFTVRFDFAYKNFDLAVGYAGWGRSCEKLSLDCACSNGINLNDWGLIDQNSTIGVDVAPDATISKASTTQVPGTVSTNRINQDPLVALNIDGQRASSVYTSNPFISISHTWKDCDYRPYITLNGGAEFSQGKGSNSAVSLWHVGMQAGISL